MLDECCLSVSDRAEVLLELGGEAAGVVVAVVAVVAVGAEFVEDPPGEVPDPAFEFSDTVVRDAREVLDERRSRIRRRFRQHARLRSGR
jgi:hypothetical protein